MSDAPRFGVNSPKRCGYLLPGSPGNYCRRPAWRARELPGAPVPLFLCAEHSTAADRAIDPDELYRRVSVTFEAVFAGISPARSDAQAEAVELVRELIASEGGIASLVIASSVVGRPAATGASPLVPVEKG